MIRLHSSFRYGGPPKFRGALRPGDEVLHLVSDAATQAAQRAELRAFVASAGLPRSLLNNPHFAGPGRPHLDVWGKPARKAVRLLGPCRPRFRDSAVPGRTERGSQARRSSWNSRTSACIPGGDPPQCVLSGRPRDGASTRDGRAG